MEPTASRRIIQLRMSSTRQFAAMRLFIMKTTTIALTSLACVMASSQAAPPLLSQTQIALHEIDPDIQADHYAIARADLNADGQEDVVALMNGKSGYCGSGGCTLFVLQGTLKGFASLGAIKVVNPPIYLRSTSHHGMRDLLARVRGGGFAALEFDGRGYPAGAAEGNAEVKDTDQILFTDPAAQAFDKTLEMQGIAFHVTSTSHSVTIVPAGLKEDNSPMTTPISGEVIDAEVADLDMDGSPEVFVYVRSKDSKKVGSLVAYSVNKRRSLSQIFLPDLAEDKKNSAGYRGGDEFAIIESTFGRRFPIYPADQNVSEPTGKLRQLEYKLKAGEAGWSLQLHKATEF